MTLRKPFLPAVGVIAVLTLAPGFIPAQSAPAQQQPSVSVADAARKARAEKKGEKPVKVFTDDDIASLKGTISVVGEAPAPPPSADAAAAAAPAGKDAKAPAAQPAVKDEAYWRKTFADARKKQADDSKELDVLQREYNLKLQQYYTDPTVALHEQNTNQDLNNTLQQINAKKQDVAQDNQNISDLEDQLRKAGGDPGWER